MPGKRQRKEDGLKSPVKTAEIGLAQGNNRIRDGEGDDHTWHGDQQNETESCIVDVLESLKTSLQTSRAKKLAPDVWSLNNTLSTMLDRHHENLNNFQVAGDTLETGGKLYGMQVDSMASNAQRMSVLLNARVRAEGGRPAEGAEPRPRRKKRTNPVSTIAMNKATLNAPLETVARMDTMFTDFNRMGDVSASSLLMVNLMGTKDSVLLLNGNFKFWDSSNSEKIDYTAAYQLNLCEDMVPLPALPSDIDCEEVRLQPQLSHYNIVGGTSAGRSDGALTDTGDPSMAFDTHMSVQLDAEEGISASNLNTGCIADLRPVDGRSNLEYSYRPLQDLPGSWAPPQHWKLKRLNPQPSGRCAEHKNKRLVKRGYPSKLCGKQRTDRIKFVNYKDDLFFDRTDSKVNTQKRWRPCSLLLSTDLKKASEKFTKYRFATQVTRKKLPEIDAVLNLPDSDDIEELENQGLDNSDEEAASNVLLAILEPSRKRAGIGAMKLAAKDIINQQLRRPVVADQLLQHPQKTHEVYEKGATSFSDVRKGLEDTVGPVSTAMALLSVLHVAADKNLRLIPQEGRKDFQIRKIRE